VSLLQVNSSKLISLALLLVGLGFLVLIFHSFIRNGHYVFSIGFLQGPFPWYFEAFLPSPHHLPLGGWFLFLVFASLSLPWGM
jgi:hypothetical protein